MKYHKIRGVDKSTCTAEQKIAYNMAWYIWNDCRYNWTDRLERTGEPRYPGLYGQLAAQLCRKKQKVRY